MSDDAKPTVAIATEQATKMEGSRTNAREDEATVPGIATIPLDAEPATADTVTTDGKLEGSVGVHIQGTSNSDEAGNELLHVSVVVPTCDRTRLLRRCLNALLRQSLPVDRYEIVVVDDGPSDATRHVVEMFAAQTAAPCIRYVLPPPRKQGPAAARNAGWSAAAAPIIAFTDDDTIPSREWLVTGLVGLHEWAAAAAGRVKVPLPDEPSDWQLSSAGLDGAEFVTANCFVRRAALVTVGGFDESFRRPWREDSDLYFSLLNKGYRVVSVPTSVVVHPVRAAPWGVSLRVQQNMFFDALLYKKHPELYRAKISRAPPVRYYAVVGTLAVALGAAITGHAGIALFAGGAWLGWTLWFAIERLRGTRRDMSHVLEMLVTSAAIPPLAVFWRIAGAFRFRVLFA